MYMVITNLSYMTHEDDVSRREYERHEYMRKKRKVRIVFLTALRDEDFHIWFSKAVYARHKRRD